MMDQNNNIENTSVKNFKSTFKKLINYLKPYKYAVLIVVILSIGSSIFSIIGPKMLGNATTEIFNGLMRKATGSSVGIDFDKITQILLILMSLYGIGLIFSYIQGLVAVRVTQSVSFKLRSDISEKINRLPLNYFESKTTGEILSRITNDVDIISQNLDQTVSQLISSTALVIGVVIMMFSINVTMTFICLIIIPVSFILLGIIIKKSQKYFKKQQEYLGKLNSHIEESYSNHLIINLFQGEQKAIDSFDTINKELKSTAWKSQFFSTMMMPVMTFIGNIGYVVISIFGGYLVIKNRIQVGDILAFTQYIRSFMQPLGQISEIASMFQPMIASSERVFEFLEADEIKESKVNKEKEFFDKEITFENVKFGYTKEKTNINNFSTVVKKGQKVAIVGPTGAGKTTIVKLLMKFYDVNSGSIKIDGEDINDINTDSLRNLFGMVLQDTWLFSDTILENIRYSKLDAKSEEVFDASIKANSDHFVRTLPNGYDMVLNEELSNISSGQKQLLTIARVILKDPQILILDEATSSVDTRTEILIQKAMDEVMKGRTSFIIAHRLSTIKNADLILVMQDGDIMEQGNHEQLLKQKGVYASLYNSQFEQEESN